MENGSIVDALDDSFSVSGCSNSNSSSTSTSISSTSDEDDERNYLNRHIPYRRHRRIRYNSDGDDSDHHFELDNSSNCSSFVVIDSSDLRIAECQNQYLCAHYKSNMDCVRLKRRKSSDTSIGSSAHVQLRTKEPQSFFRRSCTAIRNSFNTRSSRRFRYMKSVSLTMAEAATADRNNNNNNHRLRMCRSYDLRNNNSGNRSLYRRVTYGRNLSSSAGCIETDSDGNATQIR